MTSNDAPQSIAQSNLAALSQLAAEVAPTMAPLIVEAADMIIDSLKAGGKILACGNGGSAADAQHFICEFVGCFCFDRAPLPGIALTADTSVLTSIGNDYGFGSIFSRQVEGLGKPGDVLVGFSTSGGSANVLRALEAGQQIGLKTIACVGQKTNDTLDQCDLCFRVPSDVTPRIQEIHTAAMHGICEEVERRMFQQ